MHRAHLVFEVVDSLRLIVSCQTDQAPSDAEWDAWLQAAVKMTRETGDYRMLVHTAGGHPTREQSERLKASGAAGPRPRTAIVSPHLVVRFVTSAMTFMNPRISCFTPSEIDRAYAHLQLRAEDARSVTPVVQRLRHQLAGAASVQPADG